MLKSFARLAALALAILPVAAATHAKADTVVLASQSGNSYTYDIILNSGASSFASGSTISISNLYGITGVTAGQYAAAYGTLTFTGTSVTFTSNSTQSTTSAYEVALFTLTSTSSTTGTSAGAFTVNETSGAITGQVAGPVAPTPEPSSLVLLGSGLVGAATMLRRRIR